MEEGKSKGRFLDVSEYILKEFSPLTRALNAEHKHPERSNHHEKNTPQIAPIDHDASTFKITPFLNGLIEIADNQLQEFSLDPLESATLDSHSKDKYRSQWMPSRRRANSLILMNFDNDLEDIVEESDLEFRSIEESNSCPADDLEDSESSASDHEDSKVTDFNLERLKTQTEYRDRIDRYVKEPKTTLIREIRRIANGKNVSEESKLEEIKATLIGYIVEFELPCFEEAWEESHLPFCQRVQIICSGIDQNFKKQIGELTFESRRLKLLKYLEKKKLRKWRKKVSYDCRKKVADSRLRIKGKFVTRQQVREQLGISDIDLYTGDEIKELLERKKEKSISQ